MSPVLSTRAIIIGQFSREILSMQWNSGIDRLCRLEIPTNGNGRSFDIFTKPKAGVKTVYETAYSRLFSRGRSKMTPALSAGY